MHLSYVIDIKTRYIFFLMVWFTTICQNEENGSMRAMYIETDFLLTIDKFTTNHFHGNISECILLLEKHILCTVNKLIIHTLTKFCHFKSM